MRLLSVSGNMLPFVKRGSLLGEMILFPKLPKGEFVSLKYWLSFVIKMKRKETSVRTGFIAVRT
jgi:hypothetical protein